MVFFCHNDARSTNPTDVEHVPIYEDIFKLEGGKHIVEREVVVPFLDNAESVGLEKKLRVNNFSSFDWVAVESGDDLKDLEEKSLLGDEIDILKKANEVLTEVKQAAQFIQRFDGRDLVSLPQAIKQEFGNTTVIIVANKIRLYPQYAELEVFLEISRPDWKTPLMFYSPNVKFTRTGGLSGVSSVGLLGNCLLYTSPSPRD